MQTSDRLVAPKASVAIVAIGASTGGITALGTVLASLPATLPVPVVMVQHLEAHRESSLAEILATKTGLVSSQPVNGQRLEAGTAYIAPPNRNLEVGSDGTIRLREGAEEEHRPRADAMFESVARAYGSHALAVVLTGAGDDGARGVVAVHDVGGHVIGQDPATAERAGMPSAAVATGSVDTVLPLEEIGPEILRLVMGDRNVGER